MRYVVIYIVIFYVGVLVGFLFSSLVVAASRSRSDEEHSQ